MSALATAAPLAAILMFAACRPASVPLPPQRRTYTGPEAKAFGPLARAEDPHSQGNVVSGLRRDGRWWWTVRRPRLRFWLDGAGPWKFTADVFLAGDTFKATGPVTISSYVNGHLLGALRCDASREFLFEKPVPPAWLDPARPVEVAMEADKVWLSKDGTEFGFLLVSAGFLPR